MKTRSDVIKTLAVMAEIYGKEMSELAAEMFVAQLSHHQPELVIGAMQRCLRELRTFPTVADILTRLPDGRPLPEQAWGMLPRGEDETVCWTEEMVQAWNEVRHLIHEGDSFNASKAFRESYSAKVSEARAKGIATHWQISIGSNLLNRECAIADAVRVGRISGAQAKSLIGFDPAREEKPPMLSGSSRGELEQIEISKLLTHKEEA